MESVIQTTWNRSKWLIKGGIIAFIALLLKIPALYVEELIREREQRQELAIAEVSDKWAGPQHITGPVLVLPFIKILADSNKTAVTEYAYFLPAELHFKSKINPEERHRGIYKVMLFTSKMEMKGRFDTIDLADLNINPGSVKWNNAYIRMNVTDTRGLNEELKLNWGERELVFTNKVSETGEEILMAPLPLSSIDEVNNISFSTNMEVNGSRRLMFAPIGKTTTVELESSWPHPSFTGNLLPQNTILKDSGFKASWRSFSHKRNFPQQWINENSILKQYHGNNSQRPVVNVHESSFGMELFIPVNGYQKSMRSIKYALLCILLTFAAFFLIEINQKASVHPFHYGLIGVALILFYTLLLSFSEYTGFNWAYLIASVFTISLIGWFVKGLLKENKTAALLSAILVLLYVYIFTILQLQDFSLLLGSLGLFAALAMIMHFSKKIKW